MSFEQTFEKVLGKYRRMATKAEHKWLKDIYTGRATGVTVKPKKNYKATPEQLKIIEQVANQYWLKNYGKFKKDMIDKLLYGNEEI